MIAARTYALLLVPFTLACGDAGGDSRGSSDSAASVSQGSGVSLTGISTSNTGTDSDSGTGTPTEGSGSATDSATGTPTSTGGVSMGPGGNSGPKFDLGVTPDAAPGCGDSGGGVVDESYIWIPSTSDGWVSKINTRTLVEEGRYMTGPSGGTESVSRTAVSADGRFVVVNARGTGRTTMVAANVADCKDTNGNGMIDTATSVNDTRPWLADECVIWSIVHPFSGAQQHGPRGVTWTLGTYNPALCAYENPKIWLGYMSGDQSTAHFSRIDPPSGVIEETVQAPVWDGSGYAPYGGALDPGQHPWMTGLRGELVRVNNDQNPATLTRIPQPGQIQTYGMTVDPDGNPWLAGCSGPVSVYDINTAQWISIAGTSACHRGMAIDHNFHAWVASNGPCGLVEIDAKNRTLVAQHQLAQCSTPIGVSVDVDGFVWLVDQQGWAWKIDPANVPAMQQIQVQGDHYVYSDMTGGQLKSIQPPPG